ncbi:MAG: hypothetical protein EBU81_02075 [Proteobacteria bacterium]|nr:hypothetical protein [Pseudomonadota bacterium]
MTMGEQHAGNLAALGLLGSIQVARHEEARRALEVDLFDGVIPAIDTPVDLRVQIGLGGHRPESLRHEDALAHLGGATFPGLLGLGRLEGEISVEVLRGLKALIIRPLPHRKRPRTGRGRVGIQ